MNADVAQTLVGSPIHQAYVSVAPDPHHWTALVVKMGHLLEQDCDWSGEVAQLKMPTMIVVGDADAIRTAHTVEFFELLGGGKRDAGWDGSGTPNARLAILPGATHYDIFSSPLLVPSILPFLSAPMPKEKQ